MQYQERPAAKLPLKGDEDDLMDVKNGNGLKGYTVQWALLHYRDFAHAVRRYKQRTWSFPSSWPRDIERISSGRTPNPTAYAGVRLADMPEDIAIKAAWVNAINDAWAECSTLDVVNGSKLADIMADWFSLTRKRKKDFKLKELRREVMQKHEISRSQLNRTVKVIMEIVDYHAFKQGLINPR